MSTADLSPPRRGRKAPGCTVHKAPFGINVTIKPENTGRNEPESTGNTKPESTGFNNKEKLNMKRKRKDDTEMLDDIRSKIDTSGSNEKLHDIDGIQCYYTNVMNKRYKLEINIEIYQPQIIGIVESSCNSSILDSEIALDGYNLFRKDKEGADGKGGGVLLYVHKSLNATQYYGLDEIEMETSISCEVKLNEKDNLLIGLVYRSPNSTKQNGEALSKQLMMANTILHVTHKLIFGDFNYPEIKWSMNLVAAGITSKPQAFFGHCTRSTSSTTCGKTNSKKRGSKPSLLDLILTNDENFIDTVTHVAVGKSDHDSLIWSYTCRLETCRSSRDSLNYTKENYSEIRQQFKSIDWDSKLQPMKCEEAWHTFKEEYQEAVRNFVPTRKPKDRNNPLWMKAYVKKSVKKKHMAYMKYRKRQHYKKQCCQSSGHTHMVFALHSFQHFDLTSTETYFEFYTE